MSLAELFFAKHPRRPFLSRVRSRRASLDRAKAARFTSHLSRFTLEPLEPRLLMSVVPVPGLALQEIAIEPAAAAIQGTTTVLALTGDAAPASGAGTGGTLNNFVYPTLNDAGQATFLSLVTSSTSGSGVFRSSGPGLVTALARVEEAAPASGAGTGGTFTDFDVPALNNAGQAAFLATVAGSTSTHGIFLSSGPGQVKALARQGEDATNGTGALHEFLSRVSLNDAGQAVFSAFTTGSSEEIFLSNGPGLVTALVGSGDAAPASGAGTGGAFNSFRIPVLNNAGQVAFRADVSGSSSDAGIFLSNGPGLVTALARTGEAAPSSGAGTGGTFNFLTDPALNDAGQAAFYAGVFGSTSEVGIFRSSGPGLVTALVRAGEAAPDGNGTFLNFGSPTLTEGGAVLFSASLTGTAGGITDDGGLFLADGQEIIQVVREGQVLAGSTVSGLGESLADISVSNDVGQVVYVATLANGRQGLVLFTPVLHYRFISSGAWDTGNNWTLGLTPGAAHDLYIDPLNGVTVMGPAQATTVDSLTIGARASGTATLQLNGGGNLSVTNGITVQGLGSFDQQLGSVTAPSLANAGLLTQAVGANLILGSLSNSGTATVRGATTTTGGFTNLGTFMLDQGSLGGSGGVTNDFGGLFQGRGTITTALVNNGRLDTTGLLTVSGATTNVGQLLLPLNGIFIPTGGLSNSGQVTLSGGALTGTGTVTNLVGDIMQGAGAVATPFANAGQVLISGSEQLLVTNAWTNSATGQVVLNGVGGRLAGGTMTNGGLLRGAGEVTGRVINNGIIRAEGGTLTLAGASNTNPAAARMEAAAGAILEVPQGLSTNNGVLALLGGRFDNAGALMTNNATGKILGRGMLSTGGLTNSTGGVIHFADGPMDVFGTVTNNATLNVTNGTSTFFNAVTNGATGTIKNTGGVARFLGGLTNNGAFISDPADNQFTDLTISDTGYLIGGAGDRFIVSDDLLSSSTQATNWNTSAAELIFQNGVDVHDFSIVGADHAGAVGGFANNFSWGTVRLAAGQTLRLQDGNATAGGAMYVKNLVLEGGLSQINSITGNGLNIYYDSLASANGYLGEQTYNLQNGGVLAPMRSLDFDANGQADALTDGILAVRHLFGFSGNSLTTGVVDPAGLRTSGSALGSYLGQSQNSLLDVDGNGTADALSDGIVIVRYLFGFTDDALINGVVDPAGTRHTAAAIEAFLQGFLPGSTSAASTAAVSTSVATATVVTTSTVTSSVVMSDQTTATPTTDLSLAYVQQSWVKNFVAGDVSVADGSDEEELLIALPG